MAPRGTLTNRLADVVQVLQLAHKSGTLMLTRDNADLSIEQGILIFNQGQIVDANVGTLRGTEAFNRLIAWGSCYFVFQPAMVPGQTTSSAPGNMVPPSPVTSASNGSTPWHGREPPSSFPRAHRAPYRIQQVNDVMTYFNNLGFTRAHRQLFLLIDGKRTVMELMRLMGYRPEDIQVLLYDLERAGLIQQ